jgi:hypothetical protein
MGSQRTTHPRAGVGLREATVAFSDLATDMLDAVDAFLGAVTPIGSSAAEHAGRATDRSLGRRGMAPSKRSHECRGCRRDPCRCRCCVSGADLVVSARLGEVRIVPVRISNERGRPRHLVLELSDFTTHGGREVPIQGAVATRTEFTLEACDQEDAIVRIQTGSLQTPSRKELDEAGRLPDVDDCLVGYADLRVQGCGVRPIRIAVALLPRDCEAYDLRCSCGCC